MDLQSKHVRSLTASSLFQTYKPSRCGRKLASSMSQPPEYLGQLIEAKAYTDAVQVLAALLRPRELAWWVCLCAWHATENSASEAEKNALRRAVAWVRQSNDSRLQAVRHASKEGDIANPAFGAARAAALAGDNADRDPGPLIRIAIMAVQRAAAKTREPNKLAEFLQLGVEIANGRRLWDITVAAANGGSKRFTDWAMDSSVIVRSADSPMSSGDSTHVTADRLQSIVQSLSPRLAVWWACLALGHQQETTLWRMRPGQVKQLNHAVQWVINPETALPPQPGESDAVSVGGRLLNAIALANRGAPESQSEAFEAALTATRELADPRLRDSLLADALVFASEIREGKRLWPTAAVSRGGAGADRSLDWDHWMESSEPLS